MLEKARGELASLKVRRIYPTLPYPTHKHSVGYTKIGTLAGDGMRGRFRAKNRGEEKSEEKTRSGETDTKADGYEQRQTVVSQFFQLDRLVVEGQKTVFFSSLPNPFHTCLPTAR